jgi:hypothetical protein
VCRAGPSHATITGSFPLDTVKVHDRRGNVIEPAEAAKQLSGETLALISSDGRAVDPLHLRLVKEGTLVFVLPPSWLPEVAPSIAPAGGVPDSPLTAPGMPAPRKPTTGTREEN